MGHTLQDFGNWFGNNKRADDGGNGKTSIIQQWQQMNAAEEDAKEAKEDLADYYRGANVDEN